MEPAGVPSPLCVGVNVGVCWRWRRRAEGGMVRLRSVPRPTLTLTLLTFLTFLPDLLPQGLLGSVLLNGGMG